MVIPYDSYDYPRYWRSREYEDRAEKIALTRLLARVKKRNALVDIGGGFGRLAETYAPLFKKCLLVDTSQKLLNKAKKNLEGYKNITFKQGRVEKLPLNSSQFDAALMIRVVHHLPHPAKAIEEVVRVLKPKGYFILEFANKIHLKAILKAFLKGKIDCLLSHLPENISTRKSVFFFNYHPTHIKSLLLSNRFRIIKILSVSNFRASFFKKLIPSRFLLLLEFFLQPILSRLYFGPSIFILAQKKA